MQKFSAEKFFSLSRMLAALEDMDEAKNLTLDHSNGIVVQILERCEIECKGLNLRLSIKQVREMHDSLGRGVPWSVFSGEVIQLGKRIKDELELEMFFHISAEHSGYYEESLFGKEIETKFPQLTEDISEAGKCIALGRATAAVFHLMRIMEYGTQKFGAKLQVTFSASKNWQVILNEADKAIRMMNQKSIRTKRLAAVSAHLYNVKLAWRNEVMHPKQTYTLEEAEEIFGAVRGFLNNLIKAI